MENTDNNKFVIMATPTADKLSNSNPEMAAISQSNEIITVNNTGARPKNYSNVIVDDSPLLLEKNKEGKKSKLK